MNTGQMLLTLGAIMIFGIQLLNLSKNESCTRDEVNTAKFGIMGTALAKSTIDNAYALKFDANTVYGTAYPDVSGDPTNGSFTLPSGLGCSLAEMTDGKPDPAKFNDFDDYNGCIVIIDTLPSAVFTIRSRVVYVDSKLDFAPVNYCTWDKQISVEVTSPSLAAPILLSAINSYWKY